MDVGRERSQADDTEREVRIKRLMLAAVSRCGTCQRQYDLDSLTVIGHREHLWMVAVACPDCDTRGVITAVIDGHTLLDGTGDTPLAELTPAEHRRFATAPIVAADDLLDLHRFLDDFDGDFTALFAHRE